MAEKIKCPLCMTKMKIQGDVKVCPECGYRMCDHRDNDADLYYEDTDHSHSNYTTTSGVEDPYAYDSDRKYSGYTSSSSNYSGNTYRSNGSAGNTYSAGSSTTKSNYSSGKKKTTTTPVAKIIRLVVSVYVCIIICSVLAVIFSNISSSNSGSKKPSVNTGSYDFSLPEIADLDSIMENLHNSFGQTDVVVDFLQTVYGKDLADITAEEMDNIACFDIYYDADKPSTFYVYYYDYDGNDGDLVFENDWINPSSLKLLTGLNSLYMYGYRLVPGVLDNMPFLTYLSCANTISELQSIVPNPENIEYLGIRPRTPYSSTAEVPAFDVDLTDIFVFKGLEELAIEADSIQNLDTLAVLPNLTALTIDCVSLSDYSALRNLNDLCSLEIYSEGLTNISFVSSMEGLQSFITAYADYSDITPVTKLPNLTVCDIYYNDLLTNGSALGNASDLEYLTLYGTNVSDISFASNLTKLRSVKLDYSPVTDLSPLSNLPSLTNVSCYGCNIVNDGNLGSIISQ